MASIINASTSTGLVTTADTSGVLQLQTGGTTAVTVDASQNVGIGTASPASDARLTLASPTAESYVMFSRTNSGVFDAAVGNNAGSLVFKGGADSATVAGLTEFMRIDSSGNVGIGTNSPATNLQVSGGSGTEVRIISSGSLATGASSLLRFGGSNSAISGYVGFGGVANQIDVWNTLGAVVFGASNAEVMRIASGNLLVGTTTPLIGKMTVSGGITTTGYPQFNIYSTNSSTDFEWVLRTGARQLYYVNNASVVASLSLTGVWTNASDARYKENITDSQYGLATVMALKPRAYNLIDQADKPQIGFIAQEVLDVVPEVVDSVHNSVTDEDRYTLSYGNMVAVLTKAIQEQQAIIQTLTDRITALEGTTP